MERITNIKEALYGKEPLIDSFPEDRDSTEFESALTQALTWYRTNSDPAECKSWVLEWCETPEDIELLESYDAKQFTNLGPLARLYNRGLTNSDYLNSKAMELLNTLLVSASIARDKEDYETEYAPQKTRKADTRTQVLIAELNEKIDEFINTKGKSNFDMATWMATQKPSPVHLHGIKEYFRPLYEEVKNSFSDPELNEAYSNLSKPQRNKFCEFLLNILTTKRTYTKRKTERKQRKRKEVDANKLISKVKYAEKCEDLGIRSRKPDDVLNSTVTLTYNFKYRIVNFLVAQSGTRLSIKGTTIQNIDEKQSFAKRIRKPEDVIPKLLKGNEKASRNVLTSLSTQSIEATGRLNEDVLILKTL